MSLTAIVCRVYVPHAAKVVRHKLEVSMAHGRVTELSQGNLHLQAAMTVHHKLNYLLQALPHSKLSFSLK